MKKLTLLIATILTLSMMMLTSCSTTPKEKLKVIDIKLTNEQYAYAFEKGNTELQTSFNEFLDDIMENGKFDEITAKYFENEGEKVGYEVSSTDVTNDENTFVVATNCPFEPFEYLGDDGKAYGLDIEVAGLYAQENDLTLVIKNIDFDAILNQVASGYADIGMAGMTISDERLLSNDFSTPYYEASQKIIVLESNTDFDNCETASDVEAVLNGLTDKSIGFQNGTTGSLYVEGNEDWGFAGFEKITAKGYNNALLACMDMQNGNIYAVVVDEAPAMNIVKNLNA